MIGKKLLLTSLPLLAASPLAFAGTSDLAPSGDKLSPATIEKVTVLRKESAKQVGVRLVQVDNGGSTDIAAAMAPSRLYLTFHQDGEMWNLEGSYLVSQGVVDVKSAKLTAAGDVQITVTFKDDQLKSRSARYTVKADPALKEAASAKGNDETGVYTLKASLQLDDGKK